MIAIHLWFHATLIISMSSSNDEVNDRVQTDLTVRDSADVIREIVTSCELLDPSPLLNLSLICQPLYTAAMVYLKSKQLVRLGRYLQLFRC